MYEEPPDGREERRHHGRTDDSIIDEIDIYQIHCIYTGRRIINIIVMYISHPHIVPYQFRVDLPGKI
jgi:hypothetical protein